MGNRQWLDQARQAAKELTYDEEDDDDEAGGGDCGGDDADEEADDAAAYNASQKLAAMNLTLEGGYPERGELPFPSPDDKESEVTQTQLHWLSEDEVQAQPHVNLQHSTPQPALHVTSSSTPMSHTPQPPHQQQPRRRPPQRQNHDVHVVDVSKVKKMQGKVALLGKRPKTTPAPPPVVASAPPPAGAALREREPVDEKNKWWVMGDAMEVEEPQAPAVPEPPFATPHRPPGIVPEPPTTADRQRVPPPRPTQVQAQRTPQPPPPQRQYTPVPPSTADKQRHRPAPQPRQNARWSHCVDEEESMAADEARAVRKVKKYSARAGDGDVAAVNLDVAEMQYFDDLLRAPEQQGQAELMAMGSSAASVAKQTCRLCELREEEARDGIRDEEADARRALRFLRMLDVDLLGARGRVAEEEAAYRDLLFAEFASLKERIRVFAYEHGGRIAIVQEERAAVDKLLAWLADSVVSTRAARTLLATEAAERDAVIHAYEDVVQRLNAALREQAIQAHKVKIVSMVHEQARRETIVLCEDRARKRLASQYHDERFTVEQRVADSVSPSRIAAAPGAVLPNATSPQSLATMSSQLSLHGDDTLRSPLSPTDGARNVQSQASHFGTFVMSEEVPIENATWFGRLAGQGSESPSPQRHPGARKAHKGATVRAAPAKASKPQVAYGYGFDIGGMYDIMSDGSPGIPTPLPEPSLERADEGDVQMLPGSIAQEDDMSRELERLVHAEQRERRVLVAAMGTMMTDVYDGLTGQMRTSNAAALEAVLASEPTTRATIADEEEAARNVGVEVPFLRGCDAIANMYLARCRLEKEWQVMAEALCGEAMHCYTEHRIDMHEGFLKLKLEADRVYRDAVCVITNGEYTARCSLRQQESRKRQMFQRVFVSSYQKLTGVAPVVRCATPVLPTSLTPTPTQQPQDAAGVDVSPFRPLPASRPATSDSAPLGLRRPSWQKDGSSAPTTPSAPIEVTSCSLGPLVGQHGLRPVGVPLGLVDSAGNPVPHIPPPTPPVPPPVAAAAAGTVVQRTGSASALRRTASGRSGKSVRFRSPLASVCPADAEDEDDRPVALPSCEPVD
eukprot:TRINITY_DN2949_c1_g1_i1.p1 TRINITY_DN2949_c1_g1~~TRINITY_DN2949_c1_g1_i1.p1  ORF type:complete len:1078 (+),score=271.94 TRINITY_DN2949_c1_g1_i1:438-3671(+)